MEFLKKHYEKVLLGVVLLGLAVAVAFLPFKIASEKQKLEDLRNQLIHPNVKELTNLDLAGPESVLKRMSIPASVEFSAPNRLFNPMVWQKAPDGHLIKVDDANIGPKALVITNRKELDLVITLDDVTVTDSGARYRIGVKKEASPNPKDWSKAQKYCKLGDKNDTFALREAKAPPDNPTNVVLTLELNDTGQLVKISKEKGYKRADGYTVDMKYPPENKTFPPNRRVNQTISFNGEDYNIVGITTNEVVLSAKSNQKKTTVKYSVAPATPSP
jgi:hypothetical protein